MNALSALFWHNVVGRFTHISAPVALDYSTGHRNKPGKYFLELPVYLLPWTLLVVAALRRAWDGVRIKGPAGTPWRFAIAATVPFLAVLSLAATARDIYSAPALLGFGVLVALWISAAERSPTALDRFALLGTRWLVTLLAVGFAAFCAILAAAIGGLIYLLATLAILAVAGTMLVQSARRQRLGDLRGTFGLTYSAYAAAVCITGITTFPDINRWHDLGSIAQQIHTDADHHALALLSPDETTASHDGPRPPHPLYDPDFRPTRSRLVRNPPQLSRFGAAPRSRPGRAHEISRAGAATRRRHRRGPEVARHCLHLATLRSARGAPLCSSRTRQPAVRAAVPDKKVPSGGVQVKIE